MPTITREELEAKGWTENKNHREITFEKYIDAPRTYDRERISCIVLPDGEIESTAVLYNTDMDSFIYYPLIHIKTLADLESLIALLTGQELVCEWVEDGDGLMQTTCGDEFSFECEVAAWKPGYDYCPHCGREIVVKEQDAKTNARR
jgi:DNA-directed RNA polymerase subunit RPC12/RpoP